MTLRRGAVERGRVIRLADHPRHELPAGVRRPTTAATLAAQVSPSMEGDLRHFVDSLQVLALLNRRGLELVIQQVDHLLADHYARHPEDRPEAGRAETLDE